MERKELFFKLLNDEFSKYGFKYIKSKNRFTKKENGNEFIIEYETWSYFFSIQTHLEILIGEIEKIKKNAWGKSYNKFVTVGNSKTGLKKGLIEKTDTEEKVIKVVKNEIVFYHSFAKNYFKQHIDYMYLDEILNTNPGKAYNLAYNPIHTSFLAIIIAKLVKNKKIDELIIYYRKDILRVNNKFIDKYDLLVEYLKKMKI